MDRALGGPGSTVCLAAAHLALVIVALWRTRRPLLTGFHVFLGLDALAYGLRPLCNVLTGGYLLYGLPSDLHPGGAPVSFLPPAPVEPAAWAAYNRGLALQLGFAAALVAGYLLVRPPQPLPPSAAADAPARTPGFPPPGRPSPVPGDRGGTGKACRAAARLRVAWLLSLILGTAAVVAMHVLSGGAWLPGRRGGTTVTAAVPYGKILFPLAAIPLAASLPLARAAAAAQALARAVRHGAAVDDAADAAGDDGAGDVSAAGGDRDAPFAHRAGSPPARSATAPVPPPGSAIGGGPPTGAHRPRTSWPRAGASRRGIAVGRMSVTTAPGALLFGTLWATTLLLLLYQRGYLLNALVVAAFVDERLRPWTVRRLGALLVVLMLLLAVARPLAGAVADGLV
ncbi:MAG TPA: polyprenyl glycosylphosphotransferase, partial [Thermaerobacter sp.]